MESFVIKEEYNLNGTIRKRIRDSLPSYENDLEYYTIIEDFDKDGIRFSLDIMKGSDKFSNEQHFEFSLSGEVTLFENHMKNQFFEERLIKSEFGELLRCISFNDQYERLSWNGETIDENMYDIYKDLLFLDSREYFHTTNNKFLVFNQFFSIEEVAEMFKDSPELLKNAVDKCLEKPHEVMLEQKRMSQKNISI